ncbi:C45 family peptidase, partial [Streptomyces sp. NPDC006283]|uniref:C45 family peptidase n=1 Tax=Streptomyces sp. NPDC006283 TaxID=3156741 RepID=UPI0033A5595A
MQHNLPVIEISGTPLQRGRQYGEAVSLQLEAALGYYAEAFGESSGLTWQQVTSRAARWMEPVRDHAPHLLEEMQGIADGAGIGLLDVLALNARGEVIYDDSFARMRGEEEPAEGCTSFAAYGPASGDGHVWAGQNWDWRAGVADTVVMLRIVQPPKPTLIMQVEAGQIGRQGANSAGIALNANGL